MVQGQSVGGIGAVIVTLIVLDDPSLPPGDSVFPESSYPLLFIVMFPCVAGTHEKVQLFVPVATNHVFPPSTETSTPATWPPTSVAVPEMITVSPCGNDAPLEGAVILETGAVTSVDAVAANNPVCKVAGCTPMSANRLIVACCISVLGWLNGITFLS